MNTALAERQASPVQEFRLQLTNMEQQFATALPEHIPAARFVRVVMTAVQNNPDLLTRCSRQSLFNACMRAAQDGLLPDGRDGAIVNYGNEAQWMPMYQGLLKKFRNSGEFKWVGGTVVREDDEDFDHWIDESGEHFKHRPGPGAGKVVKVYAAATTQDGTSFVTVLTVAEVEKVRSVSKAKNGPMWTQWWNEAAWKTALRKLLKRLPASSDLDDLVRRDDELYDFAGARIEGKAISRPSLASSLDKLAAPATDTASEASSPGASAADEHHPGHPSAGPEQSTSHAPASSSAADESFASSADERTAPAKSTPPKAQAGADAPQTESEYVMRCGALIDKAKSSKELEGFLDRDDERELQQACGLSDESFDMIARSLNAKIEVLKKKGK